MDPKLQLLCAVTGQKQGSAVKRLSCASAIKKKKTSRMISCDDIYNNKEDEEFEFTIFLTEPIESVVEPVVESVVEPIQSISQNRKRVLFTLSEDLALVNGVNKYGVGCWALILSDSELGSVFNSVKRRTSVNIKDRWRTLTSNSFVEQRVNTWFLL